ncbi:neutrophil collagenase-like isoform X1 [Chironomus tepperi]|uniref:neutrophil collagenase-like isoform X1 n=1 Tax=Chironomus tepperi TaxID=113505 RepID=UPI00391F5CAE
MKLSFGNIILWFNILTIRTDGKPLINNNQENIVLKFDYINEKILHEYPDSISSKGAPMAQKWTTKDLTYRVNPESMKSYDDQQIENILKITRKGFDTFEKETGFKFTEVKEGPVDILVSFVNRSHPEIDPYTFGHRIIGHSFAPGSGLGGDIHLDSKIMWCFDLNSNCIENVSFFAVIQHQIGHSLGLEDSSDPNSIMYDRYSKPKPELPVVDNRTLEEIYRNQDESKRKETSVESDDTGDYIKRIEPNSAVSQNASWKLYVVLKIVLLIYL